MVLHLGQIAELLLKLTYCAAGCLTDVLFKEKVLVNYRSSLYFITFKFNLFSFFFDRFFNIYFLTGYIENKKNINAYFLPLIFTFKLLKFILNVFNFSVFYIFIFLWLAWAFLSIDFFFYLWLKLMFRSKNTNKIMSQ